jgi:pyruvate/2-oxoglutarate dehydrogenase complex dihydrolipoamide dehydrogenase (E3) component
VVDVELGPNFTVKEIAGTEQELPADLVLLAIGFGGTEPSPVFEQLGIERNPRGTITVDGGWQTDVPGVFVAGDMRRGPSLIVWAIAEGRSAAARRPRVSRRRRQASRTDHARRRRRSGPARAEMRPPRSIDYGPSTRPRMIVRS